MFGNTLPARESIIVTNLVGLESRPFVVPGSALATVGAVASPVQLAWLLANPNLFNGRTLVNLGPAGFADALYHVPDKTVRGETLMHELTHVWQIRHRTLAIGHTCEAIPLQILQGKAAYAYEEGKQWREYNLEQQGKIVGDWYRRLTERGGAEMALDPNQRYIDTNIRRGDPAADSAPPRAAVTTSLSAVVGKPAAGPVQRPAVQTVAVPPPAPPSAARQSFPGRGGMNRGLR